MINDFEKKSYAERFEHLLAVISGERFLLKKGLGNEVPFFVCPYRPEESLEMDGVRRSLTNKLREANVQVLDINLYDLSIEILKKRQIWEKVLETEGSCSKRELKDLLQNVLDPEKHLIPAMADKMAEDDFDVLFLSGVGEVFPYIRSHSVLNNLQKIAKDKPTVLFFPGAYTQSQDLGASLNLFGIPCDDRYYRAFNIFHCVP